MPEFLQVSSNISNTVSLNGEGDGGDTRISAGSLQLKEGGIIVAGTFAAGDSGDIFISASEIELSGIGENGIPSSISTQAAFDAEGTGGDIELQAARVRLTGDDDVTVGPFIKASAREEANAGNIRVFASEKLYLRNSQLDTFSERQSGGDITVVADRILLEGVLGGNITTQVFSGGGTGGNITLDADSYILAFDNTDILASSPDGTGGNIRLQTPVFFGENISINDRSTGLLLNVLNDQVDVNATGRIDGTVSSPDVSLVENNFSKLTTAIIDPDTLLSSSCIVRVNDDIGRFKFITKEGISQGPNDDFFNHYALSSIETVEPEQTSAIREPSQVYQLSNGQKLLSNPCSISNSKFQTTDTQNP